MSLLSLRAPFLPAASTSLQTPIQPLTASRRLASAAQSPVRFAGQLVPAQAQEPLFNQKISDTTFIVFDLETTGLDPRTSEIIELSALKYKNGALVDRFTTTIKPDNPIPREITEITGITNEEVADSPAFRDVMPKLARFVGEKPFIVGHNAKFDINFIRTECAKKGFEDLKPRFSLYRTFCTSTLAMKAFNELRQVAQWPNGDVYMSYPKGAYKLTALADYLNIPNPGAHRAENDVIMCASLFFKVIERLRNFGVTVDTLADLARYQGEPVPPWQQKDAPRGA